MASTFTHDRVWKWANHIDRCWWIQPKLAGAAGVATFNTQHIKGPSGVLIKNNAQYILNGTAIGLRRRRQCWKVKCDAEPWCMIFVRPLNSKNIKLLSQQRESTHTVALVLIRPQWFIDADVYDNAVCRHLRYGLFILKLPFLLHYYFVLTPRKRQHAMNKYYVIMFKKLNLIFYVDIFPKF